MTVRVQRTFEFDAPGERVWEFISDPARRAEAISVVDSYDVGEGGDAVWHIKLPIPLLNSTVPVETRETDRDPPNRVAFVGKSRVMRVNGTHSIEPTDDGGCRLVNEFVVDGRLPGVERFFQRNLDAELTNLERALREDLELPA